MKKRKRKEITLLLSDSCRFSFFFLSLSAIIYPVFPEQENSFVRWRGRKVGPRVFFFYRSGLKTVTSGALTARADEEATRLNSQVEVSGFDAQTWILLQIACSMKTSQQTQIRKIHAEFAVRFKENKRVSAPIERYRTAD